MTNYSSLDAYRSHELNIQMRTSSGDIIKMNYLNESSLSADSTTSENASNSHFKFSSHQAFDFSITGNGLDAQDKKEITALLKIAQPHIDNFLSELAGDKQHTPFNKIAKKLDDIFTPLKHRNDATKTGVKQGIVHMFDKAAKHIDEIDKVFDQAQKLLERILSDFDKFNESIYG